MGKSYVQQKVHEALEAAQGDASRAQRVLLGWAMEDIKLLAALTQPFMKGIIAHALSRASRGLSPAAPKAPPKPLAPGALDGVLRQLGRNFDDETNEPVEARPQASRRHADLIRSLAVAQRRTRLRQA